MRAKNYSNARAKILTSSSFFHLRIHQRKIPRREKNTSLQENAPSRTGKMTQDRHPACLHLFGFSAERVRDRQECLSYDKFIARSKTISVGIPRRHSIGFE